MNIHATGFRILPFSPDHAPAILDLARLCLGGGYLDTLDPVLLRPGLVFQVGLVAGVVAGFVFGWRLGPTDLAALYAQPLDGALPPALAAAQAANRLAILKTIAVDPAWQGQGLGRKLVQSCTERLRDGGATGLVVPAWTIGERANLGPVLEAEGCSPVAGIPRPWAIDCDRGVIACPFRPSQRAGTRDRDDVPGGCICGLRIYGKLL